MGRMLAGVIRRSMRKLLTGLRALRVSVSRCVKVLMPLWFLRSGNLSGITSRLYILALLLLFSL